METNKQNTKHRAFYLPTVLWNTIFNPLKQYFTSMFDIKSSVIEFKGCLGAYDANLTGSSNRMTTTCQNGLTEFFIVWNTKTGVFSLKLLQGIVQALLICLKSKDQLVDILIEQEYIKILRLCLNLCH